MRRILGRRPRATVLSHRAVLAQATQKSASEHRSNSTNATREDENSQKVGEGWALRVSIEHTVADASHTPSEWLSAVD